MTRGESPGPEAHGLVGATPSVRRRLACFVYEGVLLFGVLMMAGYLYSSLTQQRDASKGTLGLQVFVFIVLGIYFIGFWTHGGQTVAMKAWHVRLVDSAGHPVGRSRAFARYLLSWLWFIPALASVHFAGLLDRGAIFGGLLVGILAYSALAWLRPDRQFWHDAVCGTRLVTWRPEHPAPRAESGA